MQHRKANICFIAVLLHLLLLRSFDFVGEFSRVLYIFVYVASYYIPIFILTQAKKPKNERKSISVNDIRLALLCFIAMVGVSTAFSLVFKNSTDAVRLTPYSLIMGGILAPILEELLWRHGVYRSLSRYGFIPAAFISSLMFALMHSGTAGLCYAFFSGVVFCLLYEHTKSPILPIILHIFNNLLSLISADFSIALPIALMTAGMAALILSIFAGDSKKLELSVIKGDIFKNYYFYMSLLAFIVLRFTEA